MLPDILEFFDHIMMNENWEKPVPMAVLSQLGLQRFHASHQNSPSGDRPNGAPTGAVAGAGGSGCAPG